MRSPCSTYAISNNGQGCLLQRGLTLSAVDMHGLGPDSVAPGLQDTFHLLIQYLDAAALMHPIDAGCNCLKGYEWIWNPEAWN